MKNLLIGHLALLLILAGCGLGGPETPPESTVKNITATACNGQVTVSWDGAKDATWHDIYYDTSTPVTKLSTRIRFATSPYVHTSLTNGQTYYYRVNAGGQTWETGIVSADEVSATPTASVPCPYTVAGTAGGLRDTAVLQNNGDDDLTLTADGPFIFPTPVDDGSTYDVTVLQHPPGDTCYVTNGTGTIAGANVDDVVVTCVPAGVTIHRLSVDVSGMTGGTLTLQNNGGDDLDITDNGVFTFATPVADGSDYNVTVLKSPIGQICHVLRGNGTIAGADVTVFVLCEAGAYTVGGDVSGMTGGTLTLQNNGGDDLNIAQDGSFTFTTPLAHGSDYDVTVLTNPTGQTCSVTNGSGTISGASVTDVSVSCVPTSVSSAAFVAAGNFHTVAIKTDGTLWAWGDNSLGQLGDGTNVTKASPTQIGSDSDWAFVAAGGDHTVAVKTNGTLWSWGYNGFGQLGDGTTTDKWNPTQIGVVGWSTAAGAVAVGSHHTVALGGDGRLYAWGYNGVGQLGDGTIIDKHSPTQIGSDSDWASVAAGDGHTVAQKMNRTLWAWGDNTNGRLGDGTIINKHSPTQVGSDSDWIFVAAGANHTVAVKTPGGTLWAWGDNAYGQLGDGTLIEKWNPTQAGSDTNWIASVAAGWAHTVSIQTNTLWTWGRNLYGQLGDGTITSRSSPAQIGSDTTWRYVASGYHHTLAIKADGTLWAWGRNNRGQLGDGTNLDKNIPTQIR